MIPKVIHYCWFGGTELPEIAVHCIESWKKYCPDCKIIQWNETNFDINTNGYLKEAYEAKAWGFVSDVARLQIVHDYGGIYLDTDVEILKSFDELFNEKAFFGMEDSQNINLGLGFGAEKNHSVVKKMLDEYSTLHFKNPDGTLNKTPCPIIQSETLRRLGYKFSNQNSFFNDFTIYSTEYFCPKSYSTGECNVTDKTFSIHHYDGSWQSNDVKMLLDKKYKIFDKYGNKIGFVVWYSIRFFERVKDDGLIKTFNKLHSIIKSSLPS